MTEARGDTNPQPTISDVAEGAGVSSATVSYVLSGRRSGNDRISDETRQRVLETVQKLGYVPNQTARSLRRRRTERVCLLVPRLGLPVYDTIARDLQALADSHHYTVIILVGGSSERERHVLDQLRRQLADGVLIIAPTSLAQDDMALLARSGLAVVAWSNTLSPDGFDVWRNYEEEACREAIHYLARKGHRKFAFLGHFEDTAHHRRLESWLAALAELGIPADNALVCEDEWSCEGGYRAGQAIARMASRPTALLGASDIGIIGASLALRDAGLRIPDDVALVGMGNIPETKILNPPLTTIGPLSTYSRRIAEVLFARLTAAAPPPGAVYGDPWKLILRGTT